MSEHIDLPGLPGDHTTRAAEIIHAQVHYDTPPEVRSCLLCHDAVDSLNGHGLLATPAHDAAVAAKALRDARASIRERIRHMGQYGTDEAYMLALHDAFGLVSNLLRDAEREGGDDDPAATLYPGRGFPA